MQTNSAADDEFWLVALEGCDQNHAIQEDDPDSEDDLDARNDSSNATNVRIEFPGIPSLSLRLCSLPLKDGVWSPLGSQPWFGQALLASLLLSQSSTSSDLQSGRRIHQHIQAIPQVSALELGSGAVGLSGLALAWMLAHRHSLPCHPKRDTVILTDNDNDVLRQLRFNVEFNIDTINRALFETGKAAPEVLVEHLDWSDGHRSINLRDPTASLDLVVGSELVYTIETALACIRMVELIVEKNPGVLIVIIQVADRDGWGNVFLPKLREKAGVSVEVLQLTDVVLHDSASRLIPHGGTLDRFDFMLCYITNAGSGTAA